jgi:hypothetical protein
MRISRNRRHILVAVLIFLLFQPGWIVTERGWGGGRVLTHAGSNTMNHAVVWMAPRRNFAVLSATSLGGARRRRPATGPPRR